jgi:hypothetical protein
MKPESFSTLTLMSEQPWLKEGDVIKIGAEEKYDYYKVISIDGNTLIVQQLSKDGVLL